MSDEEKIDEEFHHPHMDLTPQGRLSMEQDGTKLWRAVCDHCHNSYYKTQALGARKPRMGSYCTTKCKQARMYVRRKELLSSKTEQGVDLRERLADARAKYHTKEAWRTVIRNTRNRIAHGPSCTTEFLDVGKKWPIAVHTDNPNWVRKGDEGWTDPKFYRNFDCDICREPVEPSDNWGQQLTGNAVRRHHKCKEEQV